MTKLNYNRPNGGYEKEPWDKARFQSKNTALAKTLHKESVFISGKYFAKKIGQVIKEDPRYCEWILANQPNSHTAKQIVNYCRKHPSVLNPL